MRNHKHWSVRYFMNKSRLFIYERLNPGLPWFTRDAVKVLDLYLKNTDVGLEYGSGRSTIWIGQRVGKLTSVEHEEKWFDSIKKELVKRKLKNVELILKKEKQEYIRVVDKTTREGLDFIIVDGLWREDCANYSITKLKPGGVLILDNSERYIPSESNSPESIGQNNMLSNEWRKFRETIKDWRCLWTSNGVWDTAIYIKP